MKKSIKLLSCFLLIGMLMSCNPVVDSSSNSSNSSSIIEDYYTIDLSSVLTETLINKPVEILPTFKNLGDAVSANYSVVIMFEGTDVTDLVYNTSTKVFTPTSVGSYEITVTVTTPDGSVLTTPTGKSFSKKIIVDAVIQSFAPINSPGSDVSVVEDEVNGTSITFGSSYSESDEMLDSGQYKVTGLTFTGSYSITYKLSNVIYSESYRDPAFYFGWTRDDEDKHDDCFKLSTGDGTMATWIWDGNGLANLSHNTNHGWYYNVWYNAPSSVSGYTNIKDEHLITFERFVNGELNTAVYGIKYDNEPFTYLDIKDNYTNNLLNVWVESVNKSATISVVEYKSITDTETPTITTNYPDYTLADSIDLKEFVQITDNSGYGRVLVPTFTVKDPAGNNVDLESNSFTPKLAGEYELSVEVKDLMGHTATHKTVITVDEVEDSIPLIDLTRTSSEGRTNTGMVIYYDAKLDDVDVTPTSIKIGYGGPSFEESNDVTSTVLSNYTATTNPNLSFLVFKPNIAGDYFLEVIVGDISKTKKITVTDTTSKIYGFDFFESGFDHLIIGQNTVIFDNVPASSRTGKIGFNHGMKKDWTLSFDITDLKYSAMGKLFVTMGMAFENGGFAGWEDLTIGGNINNDLWGYETSTIGTGWQTYQWRSNWQDPTNEFKPDPLDSTKGCARGAEEYAQYATGTHSYKIECRTNENGSVTYYFYIDNQIEAVHNLPAAHNNINSNDFLQFWSENMSGIVTNISIK